MTIREVRYALVSTHPQEGAPWLQVHSWHSTEEQAVLALVLLLQEWYVPGYFDPDPSLGVLDIVSEDEIKLFEENLWCWRLNPVVVLELPVGPVPLVLTTFLEERSFFCQTLHSHGHPVSWAAGADLDGPPESSLTWDPPDDQP